MLFSDPGSKQTATSPEGLTRYVANEIQAVGSICGCNNDNVLILKVIQVHCFELTVMDNFFPTKCLSFTKNLANAKLLIAGKLLADGKLSVDDKHLVDTFSINQNINRSDISARSDN